MFVSFVKMSEGREHLYTQKLYPTVNNDDLLEFRMPANTRGQLDLNNVKLHFKAQLDTPVNSDDKIVPQNYFGAKQFSSVEIRLNGEAVARRSCANEYFLTAYFQTMLNYTTDYQMSALQSHGIFDITHLTSDHTDTLADEAVTTLMNDYRKQVVFSKELEILMAIDSSIFYTDDLLPSNTTLDISFERAEAAFSNLLIKKSSKCNPKAKLKKIMTGIYILRYSLF